MEKLAAGTEAASRGKRSVTPGGWFNLGTDGVHRRLDPLPDRLQGRMMVVSLITDDDKGKSAEDVV